MARGLLIQMAGHPGSGKSTLARRLAERIGAAVLDLDTIKTTLLDLGLGWEAAAKGSYTAIYALVDDLLSIDGSTVIVDTPSYWAEIHLRLAAAADRHHADYVFVECEADEAVRARRLDERAARRSQVTGLDANPTDAPAAMGVVHHRPIERPDGRRCLVVQTAAEVDLDAVLADAGCQK